MRSVLRAVRFEKEENSSIFLEKVVFYLILDVWVRFSHSSIGCRKKSQGA